MLIKNLLSLYYSFVFWKAEHQKSSARVLIHKLKRRGITSSQITENDIFSIYKNLKKWKGSSTATSRQKTQNILYNLITKANTKIIPDEVLGVIVETRKHVDLEFVVINFIETTGLRVQLYHGNDNVAFILNSKIRNLIEQNKVFLTQLDLSTLSESYYNAIFLDENFWLSMKGRNKILIFQTDSVLCKNTDYNFTHFEHCDYIGAKWRYRLRPNGLIIDGGVGGFSYRDFNLSIECLKRFSSKNWQGGEDCYFAFHIELIGGKVGNSIECAKFCTQNEFKYKSIAAHQIARLNSDDQKKFISYCPEAKFLIQN